jgi:hypothetical protein
LLIQPTGIWKWSDHVSYSEIKKIITEMWYQEKEILTATISYLNSNILLK